MNLGEASIRYRTIVYMFVLLLCAGGYISYVNIGRLEDPAFTIKQAQVYTSYPGASPTEVEKEVTNKLEIAIQQLGELDKVTSKSMAGLSIITPSMKDKYGPDELPAIWNKLRNKIRDVQGNLPPGCQPPIVNDDFGDVYGVYYAITAPGYSYREMKAYVDDLRKELLLVQDVAKVAVMGDQQEVVYLDISRSRMADLGISQQELYNVLQTQNMVASSGSIEVGPEYIRINPTGELKAVADIGEILLARGSNQSMVKIRDIAKVTRGYQDPQKVITRFSSNATESGTPLIGERTITLGISTVPDGNVVTMGKALEARLGELDGIRPVGMEINKIYYQAGAVEASVNGFVINLVEALAIVIAVLLIFMGMRSGLLIGVILLLTVAATLIAMYLGGVTLQRISLGALIIALGMLVDNAIVVTEGMLIHMQRGVNAAKAAAQVVTQNQIPLLGATVIAIAAFSGIGLSPDSTGEYCGSLFWVLLYSLGLSWVLAVTVTPLLCSEYLKPEPLKEGADPYDALIFRWYKAGLLVCVRYRWITVVAAILILMMGLKGFTFVKNSFFPNSTTPIFFVDYWRPQGTDIQETSKDIKEIEKMVLALDGVEQITTIVGQGSLRFTLTYSAETPNASYGTLLVQVDDYKKIPALAKKIGAMLPDRFPDSEPKVQMMQLGPGGGAKIEARVSGEDPDQLRRISDQVLAIMRDDPNTKWWRSDWRQRVKVIRPDFDETRARRAGVTRKDVFDSLQMSYGGLSVGIYREEDKLLPILARLPEGERDSPSSLYNTQVWSSITQQSVPISQATSGFLTTFEDPIIQRRNRVRTITVQCDPREGFASPVFSRIRPKIEAISLPDGYTIEWGGEYESSTKAQTGLMNIVPLSFLAMAIIIVMLFNAIRQPVIIVLVIPLALAGVTAGLLLFDLPFSFMAILGTLSLIGMLIKNGIVLLDQIDLEVREGKVPFRAIIESSVSRVRPVCMAAVTTVLGMIPLLSDSFFVDMAVAIMFGLSFATVLSLIVVPVLYAIFFHVPYDLEQLPTSNDAQADTPVAPPSQEEAPTAP